MSRRTFWATTVLYSEFGNLRRSDSQQAFGFHVGIWWHNAERLVAFLQTIAEVKAAGQLLDSDLSHDSAWEVARQELHCPAATEYFDIPRGRILWDTVRAAGVVYHGNSTPVELFEELARLYGLPRWETRMDEHYLTGAALEEFYRLD